MGSTESSADLAAPALYSDEQDPRPLTRLVDIVESRLSIRHALRPAAAEVIEAIESRTLSFHVLRRGDLARRLGDQDLFCNNAVLRWDDGSPFSVMSGWSLLEEGRPFARFDATADRMGVTGLMACIRDEWLNGQDLRDGLSASMAILTAEAEALFPQHRRVVELAPGSHDETDPATFKCIKQRVDDWTPEHRLELLRQYESLVRSTHRKKTGEAKKWLGKLWNYSGATIRDQLRVAKQEASAAPGCTQHRI